MNGGAIVALGVFGFLLAALGGKRKHASGIPQAVPEEPTPVPVDVPAGAPVRPDYVGPPSVILADGTALVGQGVFIRSMRHGAGAFTTPSGVRLEGARAVAYRLQWAGMQWAAVQLVWQGESGDVVSYGPGWSDYVATLRAAGIRVVSFGWPDPEPDRAGRYVELVRASSRDVLAHIANPEAPWYGRAAASEKIASQLAAIGAPWGVTSYGGPPSVHPGFPWAQWMAHADFGVPQVYDRDNQYGPGYQARAVKGWGASFGVPIVPAWGGSSAHTPAQMVAIVNRTPCPAGAAVWWTWDHLLASSKRLDVARRVDMTPTGGATS